MTHERMSAWKPLAETLVASMGIVGVVLLFLAFLVMVGFGVCNARVDNLLALLGIVELPLWSAAVLVWTRSRRRGSRRDTSPGQHPS